MNHLHASHNTTYVPKIPLPSRRPYTYQQLYINTYSLSTIYTQHYDHPDSILCVCYLVRYISPCSPPLLRCERLIAFLPSFLTSFLVVLSSVCALDARGSTHAWKDLPTARCVRSSLLSLPPPSSAIVNDLRLLFPSDSFSSTFSPPCLH
jgi:hypothetical protein